MACSSAKARAPGTPVVRTSPAGSHGAISRELRESTVMVEPPGWTIAARSPSCLGCRLMAAAPVKCLPPRPMGSFAPCTGWQRQRPLAGPLPGHSMVAPVAEVRRRPSSSQAAAMSGPAPVTPSKANCRSSAGAPEALIFTTAPRPWRERVMATLSSSPWTLAGPHASTRGSKNAGHCTVARLGAEAVRSAAVFGALQNATGSAAAALLSPRASSCKCGSKLRTFSTTSRRTAAFPLPPTLNCSGAKPNSCKRRSTASSCMPTAGPATAPPVPTSTGSAPPGLAGR
mmetsp:Transcript_38442/g.104117  ORF Transcript_38442/g.104117 Transcript_38442/m.104117 type:complete len:286 (-) Transcript_38442:1656-2513(-)